MRTHPKDRHVLAAAVASEAQVVVTSNLRDFPDATTEPYAIEAQHPDEFLATLFALNGGLVADIVEQQAEALRTPPLSVDDVLAHLEAHVPVFVASVRHVLGGR